MTSTFEISLYPLNNDYIQSVLKFLEKLREIDGVEIHTNGMSTIIIGDLTYTWNRLGILIHETFGDKDSILVMKVAPGRREYVG